jgi:hypothetical protein
MQIFFSSFSQTCKILLIFQVFFIINFTVPLFAQKTNAADKMKAQVIESCKKGFIYQKGITDLSETNAKPEIQSFNINGTTEKSDFFSSELQYAFMYNAQSPKMKEYYTTTNQGDSIFLYAIKPQFKADKELQFQKVSYYKNTQKISYVESLIDYSYWLYSLKVHIKIYFNKEGFYVSHSLENAIKINLLGDFFHTQIQGSVKK